MKQGRYFCVPEGPDDMAQLWEQSVSLHRTTLPSWLTPEDIPSDRELRSPSSLPLSSTDREAYSVELEELEEVGLIVEEDPSDAGAYRVFMEAPKVEEIWSIGLYSGSSPTQLQPSEGISQPILTREHVADVPATFVADPFMVRDAGIWHLFFEVMNWKSGKGEIGWATSADGIAWKYRQIVLADVRCFEVTELTSTQYREQRLGEDPILRPGHSRWNAGGMHHVDPHCLGEGRWIACVDGWFLPGQTTGNSEHAESMRANYTSHGQV